jgi:hypothetical protein
MTWPTWLLSESHTPIIAEIEKELKTQSHRGTAVIAGGFLDHLLTEAIKSRVQYTKCPRVAKKMLFDVPGPLSSANAKINLGVLLGLYREEIWNDLRLANEIRNSFAHKLECRDFSFTSVSANCEKFWSPHHVGIETTDNRSSACVSVARTASPSHIICRARAEVRLRYRA